MLAAASLAAGAFTTGRTAEAQVAPERAAEVLVVAPEGNSARYLVQEQLVGFDLPNLAIGETTDIRGQIALDSGGAVIPAQSRIIVNVAGLKSDRDRRDGYVRSRILETDEYPTVAFVPTLASLEMPLPDAGRRMFTAVGSLTVRGVTKPTTWSFDVTFDEDGAEGTATTTFTFADFGLLKPRVPVLLSVEDTIRLEYRFRLVTGS